MGEPVTPSDLKQALSRISAGWDTDSRKASQAVKDLYGPLLAVAPKDGVKVHRDIAYGPQDRQVLDVFEPADGLPARRIVLFVHGGAFVRGSKRVTDEIHDNVLYWFARHGFLGINMEYRLAPEASYPAGAQDVGAAVRWVEQNAQRFSGDPEQLFLVGHSAGGTHAATLVFDPQAGGCPSSVRGLVLVSARLDVDVLPINPNRDGVAAYFGTDPARHTPSSPMAHVGGSRIPTLVVTAEFENPLLDRYGAEYTARLMAAGHPQVEHVVMKGHNHMSIVAHFNSDEEVLGRRMLRFFDATSNRVGFGE